MKKIVLILFAFLLPAFVFSAETDDSAFAAGSLEGQEDAELSAAADISDPLAEDSVMDAEAELKDVKPKEKKRIDIPRRIFEIGFDTDVGFSNNYFAVSELMKKELEIDLRKIADEIDKKGLSFDIIFLSDFFMNLNLKNGVSVGLSSGIETSGNGTISKELFEFLGYGNELNEKISVSGNLDSNLFAYAKTDVAFDIKGFRVSVGPAVFFPVFHVETTKFDSHFLNKSDGALEAAVSIGYKINSCMPLEPVFDGDFSDLMRFNNMDYTVGFDLSTSIEHQIFNTLLGRAYMRLPIVPGSMENIVYSSVEMRYGADDIFDMMKNEGENLTFDSGENVYGKERYWISRPFRTGAEIAWRPFGNWMRFNALLGFGVKYPWTEDAKAYVEYKASVETSIFNVIGVNFSSAYLNEVFIHQAGFMLNCRVLEFDFGVSAQGANFKKSCLGSGLGVYTGLRIGW